MKLGSLSAKYESARDGVAAIGWDSAGEASYGTYQIASATGTMARFLAWLMIPEYPDQYREIRAELDPHRRDSRRKDGEFAAAWKRLAAGPLRPYLEQAEHEFICATHYATGLALLPLAVRSEVTASEALRQVFWSCAVQHGPGGAAKIFSRERAGMDGCYLERWLRAIYAARRFRLRHLTERGHLTEREQAAVNRRYDTELADALRLLAQEV